MSLVCVNIIFFTQFCFNEVVHVHDHVCKCVCVCVRDRHHDASGPSNRIYKQQQERVSVADKKRCISIRRREGADWTWVSLPSAGERGPEVRGQLAVWLCQTSWSKSSRTRICSSNNRRSIRLWRGGQILPFMTTWRFPRHPTAGQRNPTNSSEWQNHLYHPVWKEAH